MKSKDEIIGILLGCFILFIIAPYIDPGIDKCNAAIIICVAGLDQFLKGFL